METQISQNFTDISTTSTETNAYSKKTPTRKENPNKRQLRSESIAINLLDGEPPSKKSKAQVDVDLSEQETDMIVDPQPEGRNDVEIAVKPMKIKRAFLE